MWQNMSGLDIKLIHVWNKFLFLTRQDFPLRVSAQLQLVVALLPGLDIFNFFFFI